MNRSVCSSGMRRREFILTSVATLAASPAADAASLLAAGSEHSKPQAMDTGEELSLADISAGFADQRLSSKQLTETYLERIARLDRHGPQLRAVIEVNPRAAEIASQLDDERSNGKVRGPLHGIPVLIKDNIETSDHMMSTAGSLALEGWYCPQDAPLIERLRAAGAVILGKANLSEWANFRSTHSISGWSGRGGQCRNPYALDRTPSGSSSGSAVGVSANLCAVAVGTETDGSVVSPASINGVVGIKPTVGLVSRRGIAPISQSQDTAGPMARSVRDAAILLGAMAGLDAADPASMAAGNRFETDYAKYVDLDGLKGARLGIARKFFADNAPLNAYLDRCVEMLKSAGAIIVDPADLPLHGSFGAQEQEVMLYEFKAGVNAYLRRLKITQQVRSLDALIRFNAAHRDREMPLFDQELLLQAQAKGPLTEPDYIKARAACVEATRTKGIDAVLAEHRLDAMVCLTSGPAWLIDSVNGDSDTGGCSSPAAVAGYPHITVPSGLHRGLPIGLSFFGAAFSEGKLIKLASGFEHIAHGRVSPKFAPSLSPAPAA
jgi:amidase